MNKLNTLIQKLPRNPANALHRSLAADTATLRVPAKVDVAHSRLRLVGRQALVGGAMFIQYGTPVTAMVDAVLSQGVLPSRNGDRSVVMALGVGVVALLGQMAALIGALPKGLLYVTGLLVGLVLGLGQLAMGGAQRAALLACCQTPAADAAAEVSPLDAARRACFDAVAQDDVAVVGEALMEFPQLVLDRFAGQTLFDMAQQAQAPQVRTQLARDLSAAATAQPPLLDHALYLAQLGGAIDVALHRGKVAEAETFADMILQTHGSLETAQKAAFLASAGAAPAKFSACQQYIQEVVHRRSTTVPLSPALKNCLDRQAFNLFGELIMQVHGRAMPDDCRLRESLGIEAIKVLAAEVPAAAALRPALPILWRLEDVDDGGNGARFAALRPLLDAC